MQTGARQTIGSFLDATLDNRYVRWAGGLLLLMGIARAVLGLVSGDPGKALVLGLSAVGGILLAALYVEPLIHRDRRKDQGGDRKASTESEQEGHGRCEALKDLFAEGRRMQRAANPLAAMKGLAGLQPPPTGAEIDRWQGRVRAALPSAHKRRFRFAPLGRDANESLLHAMASIGTAFESKESKRLKASLDELQRIMDDLDCP